MLAPATQGNKWVVHRSGTVWGLGDFMAGFLSAFLLAAATNRRLYVDHAFNKSLVSFAPYDVAPPELPNRTVVVEQNSCAKWAALRTREPILVYQSSWYPRPPNRACGWAWRMHLKKVDAQLYGRILAQFVNAKDEVLKLIPQKLKPQVVVHLRSSDAAFDASACTPDVETTADEVVQVARERGFSEVEFRIEQDSPCGRDELEAALLTKYPGASIAPPIARPSHDVQNSASQLAAWFAMAQADLFIVSPMYAMVSQNQSYAKYGYIPPERFSKLVGIPGFADHALLRLSSWSMMAALKAGADTFYVLCHKAPPVAWEELRRKNDLRAAPNYTCDARRPSKLTLSSQTRRHNQPTHVNAHFVHWNTTPTTIIIWSLGNFE